MNTPYDLIVIGAGSGGISCAVRASKLGAKVLLLNDEVVGGTCVNVGCVPKKIMWFASHLADSFAHAPGFGFEAKFPTLDWAKLVRNREAYIERIHSAYNNTFAQNDIAYLQSKGTIVDANTVAVGEQHYQANHIVLATGGTPYMPKIPGASHGITSDGFFALEKMPHNAVVVGAGYIAVELAGILQSLGARTTLCIRHQAVLRSFDTFVSEQALKFLHHAGVHVEQEFVPMMVEQQPNGQSRLISDNQNQIQDIECLIWAVGRTPNTQDIGLDTVGIETDDNGIIHTDADHNTNVEGIYALGDITHHKHLTPVAIRAGRKLAERLFGKQTMVLNDDLIPTVLFSHPPIGTVGLSEIEAKHKYGEDQIKIYNAQFKPMIEAFKDDPIMFAIKLITQGESETVVGCHIAGPQCDEMLQGFAVAMQAGATKQDFDDTIAIHPTSSEELVLL